MYGKEKQGYHRELFRRKSKDVITDLAQSLQAKQRNREQIATWNSRVGDFPISAF